MVRECDCCIRSVWNCFLRRNHSHRRMSKCFLIDGMNLIFRCFYGIPMLSNKGFPTNAVLGSVKILQKIMKTEKPDHLVFFLDKGRDPERQALLPGYKANRLEVPDPVKVQIPVVKAFAEALGLTIIERSHVEADDLIASFAHKYQNDFDQTIIFSADKDFAQCVSERVHLLVPGQRSTQLGNLLDRQGVYEKFGVYPEQIVDYLSLIGDQADNIPGVPGVGPKTASNWLQTFSDIEGIFEHIDQLKPVRFQKIVPQEHDNLLRNRQLIALKQEINDIFLEQNTLNRDQYRELTELYHLQSLHLDLEEKHLVQRELF